MWHLMEPVRSRIRAWLQVFYPLGPQHMFIRAQGMGFWKVGCSAVLCTLLPITATQLRDKLCLSVGFRSIAYWLAVNFLSTKPPEISEKTKTQGWSSGHHSEWVSE